LLELLQIFRDDENRYEYHMWKFSVHQYYQKIVILTHATTLVFCKKCCSLGLANCCWIPNCTTKKFLLILLEIFKDYAGWYGEHYCKFSLQPNVYKKCYCVLPKNCSHQTFLKKSCSLGLARCFATKLHNSQRFGQFV